MAATESNEQKLELVMQRRMAGRRHLLGFMHYTWWNPWPLAVGRHTRIICDRLTRAIDDFLVGLSTFLVIEVPIRHGKSDMASIAMPAFFLGRCAAIEPDVIMSGYGAGLLDDFSRAARKMIGSREYRALFPGVMLDPAHNAVEKWAIKGSSGSVTVAPLGGSLTGRGGHLMTVDDYCRSRLEAESPTYRQHTWEAFKDDFMTRRAPVSIVIVCATRWNVNDVVGRIIEEMDKDDKFPAFEFLSFPARREGEYEYLFPERFPVEWYETQRATLGKYSAAAQLDLEPRIRGGNMFKVESIVWIAAEEVPETLQVRFWDPASTEKELDKDDPDYTVGAKCGLTHEDGMPVLWIVNLRVMQKEAPERNRRIYATAMSDGAAVEVLVESVAGYKDAYTTLADVLHGLRTVTKVNVSGDKVVRAAPLEALFDAGNVRVVKAPWNEIFLKQFTAFPSRVEHDDVIDAVAGCYEHLRHTQEVFGISASEMGVSYPD